ncbi:DEKNAAC104272 [Brettanomyces naardenensis]|uniref:DEKNAAC104272 n=1 Tax=Brettanomyces naardenensis TaxID=13370 RepID=A0A448YPZ3_BRENA|nr:DEKNAAC104272 [Brettanomyces naardenensis]
MLAELRKLLKFVGPGLLVACAYIDPGNYSTSTAAGAQFHYSHLFVVVLSNFYAVILQCLCIKLGSVTGLDLAESCRQYLPPWLNIAVYVLAEVAIIFTDLAEVVGTAIALDILFAIPLKLGVLLTILDVIVIVFAYNPDGSMRQIRKFEMFVSFFVFLTFVCFAMLLGKVDVGNKSSVLEGFLPSKVLFTDKKATYLALGIVGATVMPHSLYLGSNLVKPRLKHYDLVHGYFIPHTPTADEDPDDFEWNHSYKPSLQAIKYCLNYSYAELIISLCVVAVFINSAILIVSGAALFDKPGAADADLLSIYEMLRDYVSKRAGLIFAVAMLFSSIAAGVVCTMSGMIVAEGGMHWRVNPLVRRLITRTIAIIPCMFMVLFMGRSGIALVLNLSQVILSLILPFCSAPLLYFTANPRIMRVPVQDISCDQEGENHRRASVDGLERPSSLQPPQDDEDEISVTDAENSPLITRTKSKDNLGPIKYRDFTNSPIMNVLGITTWGTITAMNIYLIWQYLMGEDVHF